MTQRPLDVAEAELPNKAARRKLPLTGGAQADRKQGEGACPNGCKGTSCPAAAALNAAWLPADRLSLPSAVSASPLYLGFRGEPLVFTAQDAHDQRHVEFAKACGWPAAASRWSEPEYFRDHPCTRRRRQDEDAVLAGYREWCRCSHEVMPGHAALEELCRRDALHPHDQTGVKPQPQTQTLPHGVQLYLTAWEYDPPADGEHDCSSEAESEQPNSLADDICGGVPFLPCLLGRAQHPAFWTVSKLMRWLYFGEQGTACETHVDPLASHAWMWLTRGGKSWRILLPPSSVEAAHPDACPDLFDCESIARMACHLQGSRLFHTDLRPGELLFVPSRCMHAVRNAAPGLTIAVSHNFIDATCLPATLRGLGRALEAMLAREAAGAPRDAVLEELSGILEGPASVLLAASLRAPEALAEIVDSAAAELRLLLAGDMTAPGSRDGPGTCLESMLSEWRVCQSHLSKALHASAQQSSGEES